MKSNRKKLFYKPTQLKLQNILNRLLVEPIDYDEFFELLSQATDTFYENPELEFELLISNGLPLEINENSIFLKTLKYPLCEQIFCIVDIETNGSSVKKGAQIIELGAVKVKNGEIIDKFESLVFAKEIPEFVQEVTNISVDMLKNAPRLENVLSQFKLFLEDSIFVAHDIKFDYGFVSDSFEKYNLGALKNRRLCTIDLAKRSFISLKYGLRYLKEFLDIKVENHHRAYYDALTTFYIFKHSLKNIDLDKIRNGEDLIAFSKNSKVLNSELKIEYK